LARDRIDQLSPGELPAGGQLTLLGSGPLQRLRSRRSAPRGFTTPATFRPQRFSRSRRFTPPGTFPGLFHPGNALGVWPSGIPSSRGSAPLSRPLLSCRWQRTLPVRTRCTTRLQRVTPPVSPHSPTSFWARRRADSLLAFSPLGLSLPPPQNRLPDSSSQRLSPEGVSFRGSRLRVSPNGGPGISLLRERRPFWGFPPRRGLPLRKSSACR